MSPRNCTRLVSALAAVCVALASLGCGGGAATPPPPQIIISLSNTTATLQESTTAQFTATLVNDTTGKGVTWSVSCSVSACGSVSPGSTAGGVATTYSAPGPPASDLTVTLTATALADSTKSAKAIITVPAISLSLLPASANVQVGSSLQISGTVNNDASNGNVNWALNQNGTSCSPGCGTITPTSTGNGGVTTYTAPATPPASNMTVMVTGSSATDATKSASANLTVPSVGMAVTPAAPIVLGNATTPLTATLVNDSTNKGVNWTVSCSSTTCGGVSPTSTASGIATTYTAPPPPASDMQVTVTATSVANPIAMAMAAITIPAITIDVEPQGPTVIATTTQPFTATVANDPNHGGVTWAVSCSTAPCGSISPTSTASGAATTYTAPPLPSSDLSVTVTATSVTSTANAFTTNVTVPAIAVSAIAPPSGIIPITATPPFTAKVFYDPTSQGLNWTLTQSGTNCSPGCGTMNPASTPSGAPSSFNGPATLPSNTSVTVNAASITDATKSSSVAITLTNGTVQLIPASLTFSCKLGFSCPPLAHTVTLTNTGAAALTITDISATGSFLKTSTCGASLSPTGSCTVSVTFAPKSVGTFHGTVVFNDSSPDSPQQISLTGTARPRRLGNATDARANLAATNSAAVPPPTGPNVVGTRVLDLVDPTRKDPYLANGSKRELAIRLWYPMSTHSNQDCKPAEYASPGVWNYFAQLVGVRAFPVATNSCLDAAVAEGTHPVVVFTPGYTGTFTDYTFLMEDLASRGYVVAAIDHTYEATAVEFSDGRIIQSLVGSHLGGSVPLDRRSLSFAVEVRIKDLKFVLGEIGRLNASRGSPFAGKLDLAKIVVAGHSLGGLTAFLVNQSDPRVKGAILMDALLPDVLPSGTRKPVLILDGDRQQWDATECRLWSNLQGPRLAVSLLGTEHVALSDWIWLTKDAVQTGRTGPQKTMSAMRDYVAAFLDANLRGEPVDPLLTGSSLNYPDARITVQDQFLCGKP